MGTQSGTLSAAERARRKVKIVPMHPPHGPELHRQAVEAGIQPHLDYNNGPLLSSVKVFTVFWGGDWQNPPLSDLAGRLNEFFQFILTSELMDQLGEYSVPQFPIGHGELLGTVTIADPVPHLVHDARVQEFVQQQIDAAALPPAAPNILYFVYLPPQVTSELQGDRSCVRFCGYHSHVDSRIFYAVMPFPSCLGCRGNGQLDEFNALTMTSSHELCEAITDPVTPDGWYWFADEQNQGEIGDICNAQPKQVGQFTVQKEWSNQHNACI